MANTDGLVPVTLIPVEVFAAGCDQHEGLDCPDCGYGLMDAISPWSDCNRACGKIYRVVQTDMAPYAAGTTLTVYVPQDRVSWLDRRWGSEDGENDDN